MHRNTDANVYKHLYTGISLPRSSERDLGSAWLLLPAFPGKIPASADNLKRDQGCSTNIQVQNDPYPLPPVIIDRISRYYLSKLLSEGNYSVSYCCLSRQLNDYMGN